MDYFTGPLKKYADFSGRARRKEYWMFFLVYIVLSVIASAIDAALGMMILSLVLGLGLFIPSLSLAVRRLHDTGRSGWWLLLAFIPVLGGIVLLVFCVQDSHDENNYGENPKMGVPA